VIIELKWSLAGKRRSCDPRRSFPPFYERHAGSAGSCRHGVATQKRFGACPRARSTCRRDPEELAGRAKVRPRMMLVASCHSPPFRQIEPPRSGMVHRRLQQIAILSPRCKTTRGSILYRMRVFCLSCSDKEERNSGIYYRVEGFWILSRILLLMTSPALPLGMLRLASVIFFFFNMAQLLFLFNTPVKVDKTTRKRRCTACPSFNRAKTSSG